MLQFQPQEHLLHSYIVASQSEQVRDRLSLDLAAAMLCRSDGARPCRTCRDCRKVYDGVHPDVIYVAPDPDAKVPTIKVDQIRGVAATAYILPSEAEKKVYVLRQADTSSRPQARSCCCRRCAHAAHCCATLRSSCRNRTRSAPWRRTICARSRRKTG